MFNKISCKPNTDDDISKLKNLIENADCVLIGAGSGLSAASGLTYSGDRFEKNFGDFINRYGFKDMYSAGFYPFGTQEEKWAYTLQARNISMQREKRESHG